MKRKNKTWRQEKSCYKGETPDKWLCHNWQLSMQKKVIGNSLMYKHSVTAEGRIMFTHWFSIDVKFCMCIIHNLYNECSRQYMHFTHPNKQQYIIYELLSLTIIQSYIRAVFIGNEQMMIIKLICAEHGVFSLWNFHDWVWDLLKQVSVPHLNCKPPCSVRLLVCQHCDNQ